MSYKTTDGLAKHLEEKGIKNVDRNSLRKAGYYHGYKGYRFFRETENFIPYKTWNDIYQTIAYDTDLKALFYSKVMYVETAIKNIVLEVILSYADTEEIDNALNIVLETYNNTKSQNESDKIRNQQTYLNIKDLVYSTLATNYKNGNEIICHFFNSDKYTGVPLWALIEVLSLGDFAFLVSGLKDDVKTQINQELNINEKPYTLEKLLYLLKDLRNAIAHNNVVFDTRFNKGEPSQLVIRTIENELKTKNITFKRIEDYVLLLVYLMKKLNVPETEINTMKEAFVNITADYLTKVDIETSDVTVSMDFKKKLFS